jgi:hypothetical protein
MMTFSKISDRQLFLLLVPQMPIAQSKSDTYHLNIAIDSAKRTLRERVKMYKQRGNKVKSMAIRQPRYSKEKFAQRGDALYDSQIRLPKVGFANAS